jgi:ABC-2 type transport system ATP-binding protein
MFIYTNGVLMNTRPNPAPAILTSALSRQYGSLKAVDKLSLEILPGTIFGFLGPNGAGKTTTIRLLLGLLAPNSGSGQVLGFDIKAEADLIRDQTGALLEHTGIYEQMSAADNLEFYGRIYHLTARERSQRVQTLLKELDLWERRHDLAGSWSRGMKQKLALARVLLHKPKLIFLDEPTAGLDVVSAADIRAKIKKLVEKDKVTVFLTSHNMSEVEQLCSQVAVIKAGQLIAQGSPDQLKSIKTNHRLLIDGEGFSEDIIARLSLRPEIRSVEKNDHGLEVDILDENTKSDLISWLVREGVQLEGIRQDQSSLEDVFITLMEEEDVC